jgi:hypothetical protein
MARDTIRIAISDSWTGLQRRFMPCSRPRLAGEGSAAYQGREVIRATRLPSLEEKVLFRRCGSTSIYVRGFCQRCYQRERADRKHFAGLREQVLARDGHRCRGCQAAAVDSVLSVHHRQPGRSSLELLVTLCPACHALIERTQVLFRDLPELLRVLWREHHPAASEQMSLAADKEDCCCKQRIKEIEGHGLSIPTLLRLAETFQIPLEKLIANLGVVEGGETSAQSTKK